MIYIWYLTIHSEKNLRWVNKNFELVFFKAICFFVFLQYKIMVLLNTILLIKIFFLIYLFILERGFGKILFKDFLKNIIIFLIFLPFIFLMHLKVIRKNLMLYKHNIKFFLKYYFLFLFKFWYKDSINLFKISNIIMLLNIYNWYFLYGYFFLLENKFILDYYLLYFINLNILKRVYNI